MLEIGQFSVTLRLDHIPSNGAVRPGGVIVADWTRWKWRQTGDVWVLMDPAGLHGITLTVQPDMVGDAFLWICGIWVTGAPPRRRFWTETVEEGMEMLQDFLAASLCKAIDLEPP